LIAMMLAASAALEAPPSLAFASWGGFSNPTQPKEWGCDKVQMICLDALADVRFIHVKTIAGSPLERSVTAATAFHAPPRRGMRILVAVTTASDGTRQGKILRYVLPGKHQACLDMETITARKYPVPSHSERRGDEICFRAD